jgi:hypothetical protein
MSSTFRLLRAAARLTALALVAADAKPAAAYSERMHFELTRRALPEAGPTLSPPDEAELATWRAYLWERLAAVPDRALQQRFLVLAPTAESFTPGLLKRLLMMNERVAVAGIDRTIEGEVAERELLSLASRLPDDDLRNQSRHWRDDSGAPRLGPTGEPLPIDPAILDMGRSSGLSSQAHAHYQLLPAAMRTDETATLKHDPRRFSLPRDAHTFGADFAALYADLATLAASGPMPHSAWIAAVLAGSGFHHVQDVCNQIHTVQVGLYDFFVDAQLSVWKEELRTLGGLLGPRVTLKQAGLKVLTHHHVLLEDLFVLWLLDGGLPGRSPGLEPLKSLISTPDPDFTRELSALPGQPFERAALEAIVLVGSAEASRAYELARELAAQELSYWRGRAYEEGRPLEYLRATPEATAESPAWAEFVQLEARGARRFAAFLAARAAAPKSSPEEAAARLLRLVLDRSDEAGRRRAGFVAEAPAAPGLNAAFLAGAAALVALAGLALRVVVRRRRTVP